MPKLGITLPNMGTDPKFRVADAASQSANALFTTTQQRVLGLLFGQPQRGFTVSEVIASTGAGSGATQRELAKLADSGLVTVERIGNQKQYKANPYAPVYGELIAIVRKTLDPGPQLSLTLTRDAGDKSGTEHA